ncbi:hypothetical protein WMO27_11185 [Lachnospiraceae bacterium CLA-AA-H183]
MGKMSNIIIFSQNVVLRLMDKYLKFIDAKEKLIFITPHMLLENEKAYLEKQFKNCEFYKFADFLSDKDNEECDYLAYEKQKKNVKKYFDEIKRQKNNKIIKRIEEKYANYKGYLLSDDLGIDATAFIKHGFVKVEAEYYYKEKPLTTKQQIKKYLLKNVFVDVLYQKYLKALRKNEGITTEVSVAYDNQGKKYVFFGNPSRVAYRMDLHWEYSNDEYNKLNSGKYETKEKCEYLSSLHESWKCPIPDNKRYSVRYIQDGYLPPNYSSKYLMFKPSNVKYYAWDILGEKNFKLFNIPVQIMPFRKKLYLPLPLFKKEIQTILVATSGPGDWTAQKNRSDEDLMLEAFVEIARRFPDIDIIYRCHPTWIHPEHNGVNSIKRVEEYLNNTGLKNIHLSSNIPTEKLGDFKLSFPRSSLEEDLKKADIVFGEHSVSMLDGGFKQLPFASVNLTNRRNLFCGISDMGFPHCTSVDDIENVIKSYGTEKFKELYSEAVKKYNTMTDMED